MPINDIPINDILLHGSPINDIPVNDIGGNPGTLFVDNGCPGDDARADARPASRPSVTLLDLRNAHVGGDLPASFTLGDLGGWGNTTIGDLIDRARVRQLARSASATQPSLAQIVGLVKNRTNGAVADLRRPVRPPLAIDAQPPPTSTSRTSRTCSSRTTRRSPRCSRSSSRAAISAGRSSTSRLGSASRAVTTTRSARRRSTPVTSRSAALETSARQRTVSHGGRRGRIRRRTGSDALGRGPVQLASRRPPLSRLRSRGAVGGDGMPNGRQVRSGRLRLQVRLDARLVGQTAVAYADRRAGHADVDVRRAGAERRTRFTFEAYPGRRARTDVDGRQGEDRRRHRRRRRRSTAERRP